MTTILLIFIYFLHMINNFRLKKLGTRKSFNVKSFLIKVNHFITLVFIRINIPYSLILKPFMLHIHTKGSMR